MGREGVVGHRREEEEEGEMGVRGTGESLPSGANRLFHHLSYLHNYNLS